MVVYAETHSRPDDHDQLPDHGREDGLQGDPVLLEWVRCVARLNFARAPRVGMSNPVPGGSARKSAAIIPFVNESLTSGLPIASTPQFVNNFNSCRSVNDRACAVAPAASRTAEQRDEVAPTDHSITSSARASSVSGTVRPSILAATVLITISNLVACSTGKSAGFVPLMIRPA
jgi:hypothetical protein